jgi:RNA-directed DNA polymerase
MNYNTLTSLDNLFIAWQEFRKGKKSKKDVLVFERYLEDNLFSLFHDLQSKTYRHGSYESFYVNDPKRRHIHKARVRDRVVHHLLYTYLYKLFDKQFICDSYSCRIDKGTHKAVDRLEVFTRKVSKNYARDCWVLHCDIKKFFASVDHEILKELLNKKISDPDICRLLSDVIDSFNTGYSKGIPLGNLTSQIFANIYLNDLDQFVKHELRIKYYIRYADDFVIVSRNKEQLESYIPFVGEFLKTLKLDLHPQKITIRKLSWGIDFLGYISLPYYRLPRTQTRRRLFQKLDKRQRNLLKNTISYESYNQSLQSYLGYLKHTNSFKLKQHLINRLYFLHVNNS